jgi:SnoaL-like domain
MTADALDPLSRLLAERACERLIIDFVHRLDLGEAGSVAELFTADGIWEWPDGDRRIQGRDALRRYFGSRPRPIAPCGSSRSRARAWKGTST